LENRRQDGEDVTDEMMIAVQASEKAGTQEGRTFRARQEVRAPDFSLPGMLRQHTEIVGSEPSPKESAEYAKLADRIRVLEAEKQDLLQKLAEEAVARKIAELAAAKKPKEPPAKKGTKRAKLEQAAAEALAAFKQEWATLFEMGAIADPKREADK
jgi:hypothetical protein